MCRQIDVDHFVLIETTYQFIFQFFKGILWTSVPFASGWTFTLISQDESIHIFVAVKPWASVSYTDHQLIHRDAIAEYVESRMNDAGME